MRYRTLGTSGLVVSVVGLGCNNFGRGGTKTLDLDGTRAVVDAALDAGVTLFDTSDSYGSPQGASEELLGRALAGRRDEVLVATKFGSDLHGLNGPDWGARGSRRYINRAVEASLRRLGTDWIDLYQYHFPDKTTPVAETLAALDDLVRAGKVRYVGSSNMAAWEVAEAEHVARQSGGTRFISAQNHYSLLQRAAERELLPACAHFGVGFLPYFPLGSGLLTGKFSRDVAPQPGTRIAGRPAAHANADWDRIEALAKFGAERGRSLLDVAIAGLAGQPAVTSVIAGATSPDQVAANVAAGEWEPTPEDITALNAL